jgi:flavorubredoxin
MTLAGAVKDSFDRTFLTLRDKVIDKHYAAFGSAGGGGKHTLGSLDRLCGSLGLKKAAESVVAQREPSSEALEECKELDKKMAQL